MDIQHVKSVYLLGIGGIGMSALARFFASNGAEVSGYDRVKTPLCASLESEGIQVHYDATSSRVNLEADLFIYTPAIKQSNELFQWVRSNGKTWLKRSEILERLTSEIETVAIGGTHGKTTTSALVTHVLNQTRGDVSGFVGGIMNNYGSNLVTNPDSNLMVVEADEYDRSFLRLKPAIAVITSLEADHLDIYGTFDELRNDFKKFAQSARSLVLHESLIPHISHENVLVYGFEKGCDVRAENIRIVNHQFQFDVAFHGESIGAFASTLPGRHNVENVLAAIAVSLMLKCDPGVVGTALSQFTGVYRRFEKTTFSNGITLVDDYAHHPTEINAAISAARELFPDKKVTTVFQPHLFSRTQDLEDGFIESLNNSDEVVLLPIYPAREMPITGVSSANLLNKLSLKTKLLVEKSHLVNAVLSLSPETVLMLGAGDIDQLVKPLANALGNEKNVE